MEVKIAELRSLGLKALEKYGHTAKDADAILDVLMYAQLRGNNQGLVKLIGSGYQRHPNAKQPVITKETKLSALINGNLSPGIVVLKQATEVAIKKAKEHGFGIVGTNNTNSSTGAIGYYAKMAAKEGFVGIAFAGSPELIAMHGSSQPIFGTNPIAISIPTQSDPIVLDMATASIPFFGLVQAKTAGKPIPEGLAYDKEGNKTTDPAKALEGSVTAFGGHKGAGLAMMIEVLTGPLVKASFSTVGDVANNWGNLVMVIDPELLTDRESFKKEVSLMIEKVKATRKLQGVKEILIPGERGDKLTEKQTASGKIEIEENLYKEIQKAAKQ
ncbi:MAG: Ldh family oxidoreductase [Candidatus Micrarchaeales archaeon]|nr:Ldh family oxidoreductase [Candidatus Micrarchaeales archaeon]